MAYNYRFHIQNEDEEEEKIKLKEINFSKSIERLKEIQNTNSFTELNKLCEEIIDFYDKKQKMLDLNIPMEKEKKKMLFHIYQKTERLLIESIYMKNKENQKIKVIKIYNWFLGQIKKFNDLKLISERTEKEWYQQEEIMPQKMEVPKVEEIKKHRSHIMGYESAKKRIKDYHTKSIKNSEKYSYNSFQDEKLNFYGKDFGYNTMTNFKPLISSPNIYSISQNSTKYGTFYNNGKVRAEINTGSDWFSRTGLDFKKEVKESYSYVRPPYEYEFLDLENKILEQKHKELAEKRNEEEINNAIMEFGFRKSFYNRAINEKKEMKDMIEKYKDLLNEKKVEEEKKRKEEERKRKIEEEILRKELRKKKEIAMSKIRQIKKSKKEKKEEKEEIKEEKKDEEIKVNIEEPKIENKNEKGNEDKEDIKQQENIPKEKEKENIKVNLNNIKFINPFNDKEIEDKNFLKLNEQKSNVIVKEINSKDTSEKLKKKSLNCQYNNYKKLQLEIDENSNNKINKKISMPSTLTGNLLFNNKIFLRRYLSRQLNGFKEFDMIKNKYQENILPLSLYDEKHKNFRNLKSKFNENVVPTENFAMKTFYNNKNNFLQMRKTLSAYNEKGLKNNLLYNKSKPKFRIVLEEVNFSPSYKKKFNMYYLPYQKEKQLLTTYKFEDKKGKKSRKK